MPFVPKDWRDFPDTATPITAAALEDQEARLSAYTDSITAGLDSRLDDVEASGGGTLGSANTADTGDPYKIILLSDGTVKAIPVGATPPDMPTGVAISAKLSSVRVSWSVAARAAQYIVYRNGTAIKTTTTLSYRDLAITSGSTYQYQVQAVDTYGQRSPKTANFPAFIDPALNVAPTVTVKAWPPVAPTNGRTYLRVNANDLNAQTLEYALQVTAGSIVATDDPSVWIYTP